VEGPPYNHLRAVLGGHRLAVMPQVNSRANRVDRVQAGLAHGFLEAPAEVSFFFGDRHT